MEDRGSTMTDGGEYDKKAVLLQGNHAAAYYLHHPYFIPHPPISPPWNFIIVAD